MTTLSILVRAYWRTKALRAPTAAAMIVAAALGLSYSVQEALTRTPEMVQLEQMGGYGALAQLDFPARSDEEVADVVQALQQAGATEATYVLRSLEKVTGGSDQAYLFAEGEWGSADFPQYVLESGRWPQSPGEVVVTPTLAAEMEDQGTLTTMSGLVDLAVVGTVTDELSGRARVALAGPGTVAGLPWDELEVKLPSAAWGPTVYWSGLETALAVDAIATALGPSAGELGLPEDPAELQDQISSSVTTASLLLLLPARSMVTGYPLGYLVPALLLPGLLVAFQLVLGERRLRRSLRTLEQVGIDGRSAAVATAVATSARLAAAVVVGLVVGLVAGVIARPLLATLAQQPLAPVRLNPVLLSLPVLSTLVAAVVVGVMNRLGRDRPESAAGGEPGRVSTAIRWIVMAASLAAIVIVSGRIRGPLEVVQLTIAAAALLIAAMPDVVVLVLKMLPRRRPDLLLAARIMERERARVSASAALILATLGPAVAMLSMIGSVQATSAAMMTSPVPSGQALLATDSTLRMPAPEAQQIFRDGVSPAPVVTLTEVGTDESPVAGTEDGVGRVLGLDSPADLDLLCGSDSSAATTLNDGGIVSLRGPGAATVWRGDGTRVLAATPVDAVECAWSQTYAVVVLVQTASDAGLPVTPSALVAVDVDPADLQQTRQALESAGFPRNIIEFQEPMPGVPTPPVVSASVAAVCLFAVLGAVVVTSGQVRALRTRAPALRALGLGQRWIDRVLRHQLAAALGIGCAAAAVAVAIPLLLVKLTLPSVVIRLPWPLLGLTALALVVALMTARVGNPRESRSD